MERQSRWRRRVQDRPAIAMGFLRVLRSVAFVAAAVVVASPLLVAHHEPLAKFDDKKPVRLRGVVSLVDWRNPHAHVFMNVTTSKGVENWAVELESPIDLEASGWSKTTVQAGDKITVTGMFARDGSRQVWGKSVTTATGKKIFTVCL